MDTRTSPVRLRLGRVREAMAREGLAALLVPSSDPHLSEYLPARWQGRAVAVGLHRLGRHARRHAGRAALFADSRYWTQAEAELAGSGIELVKIPTGASPQHIDWLAASTWRAAQTVGGRRRACSGLAAARRCATRWTRAGITLRTDLDLLDARLARPPGAAGRAGLRARAAACAAAARRQAGRRARRRWRDARRHAPLHLDRRRHRLAVQPARRRRRLQPGVPGARAGRARGRARCSSATARSTPRWPHALAADGVRVAPYDEAGAALAALPAGAALLLDPRRVTLGLRERVPAACSVVEAINPTHAGQEPQDRRRGGARARARWSRTARRCASSSPGSRRRWPTPAARAAHRADDRRAAHAPRARAGPASSA